jgi:hypothetical protein
VDFRQRFLKSLIKLVEEPIWAESISTRSSEVLKEARLLMKAELSGETVSAEYRRAVFTQYAVVLNETEGATGKLYAGADFMMQQANHDLCQ